MAYLRKRGKHYHFRRRIPIQYERFFHRDFIQLPLETTDRQIAEQRAISLNQTLEDYLSSLPFSHEHQGVVGFKRAYDICREFGFQYLPMNEILRNSTSEEIVQRILLADTVDDNTARVLLGGSGAAALKIDEVKDTFIQHLKDDLHGYSGSQLRKWEAPKLKAIKNFEAVLGSTFDLRQITRQDVLSFRSWWVERIERENLTANSANKDFGVIKKLLHFVSDNHDLDIPLEKLFRGIRLKQHEKTRRFAFTPSELGKLVDQVGQSSMNLECKLLIFAMMDTGCRVSELTGLEDSDVILDDTIPYIKIRPNSIRKLKTPQSERTLPLVGNALDAFKRLKGGFEHYQGKPDLISTTINKYARKNHIFPSINHSLYSLRHSFEDRLTIVEPPDKVQASIMGHKYSRPRYGKGPSLEQKRKWLEMIVMN